MARSTQTFAEELTAALRRCKANTGRTLEAIQDELGFSLGRDGGASFIYHLRRGHVPQDPADAVRLAQALVYLKGLDEPACLRLLTSAGHPSAKEIARSLFASSGDPPMDNVLDRPQRLFVTGRHIQDAKYFFGREYEIRRIFDWWHRVPMTNIAIVGPKRSGKTSLTHFVQRIHATPPQQLREAQRREWLPGGSHYRFVRVDFQDTRLRKLEALMRYLVAELALPEPTVWDLDHFLDIVSEPQHWAQPTIVIMDDIDRGLSSPELGKELWDSLRAILDSSASGTLAFLVTAHTDPALLAEHESKTSSFFAVFRTLPLGSLTDAEAHELLAMSVPSLSQEELDWVLEHSRRWPMLIQLICDERKFALDVGDTSDHWQQEALRQISTYTHLV